jgi:hypothetical protein
MGPKVTPALATQLVKARGDKTAIERLLKTAGVTTKGLAGIIQRAQRAGDAAMDDEERSAGSSRRKKALLWILVATGSAAMAALLLHFTGLVDLSSLFQTVQLHALAGESVPAPSWHGKHLGHGALLAPPRFLAAA